ncbi:unnamed protein product [Adineta steineri]|uniref:Uncharacterized protein n=3 Tax=Adineta steineri TaxID=433720 RepID=A0A815MC24_9BILA|nr:unnamed protein product [Adineta steineri]
MKYCIRWNNFTSVTHELLNDCINGGEKWLYTDAIKQNISPTEVLTWSSSIEYADDYAHFYYNNQSDSNNKFLCNCTQQGTFGPRCEFELLHETITFEDAIKSQFAKKKQDRWGIQRYGDILCYNTVFECDYGLLCLDWRNICDGEQQCMNGTDEENCDLLEFNECEDDEYRCVNGMCINEQYWLDGELDCMDRTDETVNADDVFCPHAPGSIECEESVCIRNRWSCGDGQCLRGIYRLSDMGFTYNYCESMREFNYMCEIHPEERLWTRPNGLCWDLVGFDDSRDMNNKNLTNASKCIYLIRCALSVGFEQDCPCNGQNCSSVMANVCETGSEYIYPDGSLLRPYIKRYYQWDQSWSDKQPPVTYLEGSIKCRGFYGRTEGKILLDEKDLYKLIGFPLIDFIFCNNENIVRDYESPIQYHKSCWNESRTWNGRQYAFFDICIESHECISQYRIGDGYWDCDEIKIESMINKDLCANVEKHRFQCDNEPLACLSVRGIGDKWEDCSNGHDEFIGGLGDALSEINCQQQDTDGCHFLREYSDHHSRINITNTSADDMLQKMTFPFNSYCDTIWNFRSHFDELPEHCDKWVCHRHQYQCQTGHCISIDWLCDGEWDCPDASDEQAIDLNSERLSHNMRLSDFKKRSTKCQKEYAKMQPFMNKCNVTTEFPCFLANVTDPLNINTYRPCINLTQIGDTIENCYGGLDEKNTLENCDGSMLGFSLRCNDKRCLDYYSLCQQESGECRSEVLCHYKSKNQSCSGENDVKCLDGSCIENARCNQKLECPYGEDEYWCPLTKSIPGTTYKYRNSKRVQKIYWESFWPRFPSSIQSIVTELDQKQSTQYFRSSSNIVNTTRVSTHYSDSYKCNRGVAVSCNNKSDVVCFCPPAYYGRSCQYFSDRLTVYTHLNLSSLPTMSYVKRFHYFKIIASLIYGKHIIDFHEFIINGDTKIENSIKHKFYLLYSSSDEMKQQKKLRHFNRTDIIKNQPYSIRFDIYKLSENEIDELGSWVYPIYFDFLPAFRLATILTFPKWYGNLSANPCMNNTSCPQNSRCLPIFNQEHPRFRCSCRSNFYGKNCETIELKCLSYCSSNALCKPENRGQLTNTNNPLCICPLHRFGPRCNLRHDECRSQPCLNNGTCHLKNDPSGQKSFICKCSKYYYGDYCEKIKLSIYINLNMSRHTLASIIQFYDVRLSKLQLLIQHQQVVSGLPTSIRYNHDRILAPPLAILKVYDSLSKYQYYILYIQQNVTNIHINSTPQQCLHVTSFSYMQNYTSTTTIFHYHHLCRNDNQLLCFHDQDYLCICEYDHSRVDCLSFGLSTDQCNLCFSDGKCLQGDLNNPNDFLCLCPKCSHGQRCEFTTFAFGFTLDLLLVNDLWIIQIVYTCLVALLFIIGIFTNTCSLVTFKRPYSRTVTVGNYLYIVSIINQCALLFLLLKFIHILGGFTGHDGLNLISCKIISYILFVLTRTTFWLLSWVTCDRLLMTIFPTSLLSRKPNIAIGISVATMIALSAMHIPDIIYTTIAGDRCIVNFDHPLISLYNRINTLLHYLGTFAIQTIAITLLIILIARSRAKVRGDNTSFGDVFKSMFNSKKELYVTPIIIVLSALPQTILSFSLSCTELSIWQRHTLLIAYLFSYSPQILGFILFVLPSKAYQQELQKTKLSNMTILKWILKRNTSQQFLPVNSTKRNQTFVK